MNKKIWNINLLLCKEVDKDIIDITKIFNKLYLDDKNRASFVIVTLMNAIFCDEEKFRLYYFLEKVEKDSSKVTLLGSALYTKMLNSPQKGQSDGKSYIEGLSNKISSLNIDNFEFIGPGNYEIQVYKYDNEEAEDFLDSDNVTDEEFLSYTDDKHLTSVYPFEVCLKQDK